MPGRDVASGEADRVVDIRTGGAAVVGGRLSIEDRVRRLVSPNSRPLRSCLWLCHASPGPNDLFSHSQPQNWLTEEIEQAFAAAKLPASV
jgi:hypothetical protein